MKLNFTLFLSLWIATTNLFSQVTLVYTEHDPIISWHSIYDITQDAAGNIWASAAKSQVLKYDGTNWEINTLTGFPDLSLRAIGVVDDNNIWTGDDENGLLHFDGTTWTNYTTSNSMLPHEWVRSIAVDNGIVWVGTSNGVVRIDGSTWTVFDSELPDGNVNDIEFDNNGNVWLANDNYIVKYNGSTWEEWFADDATGWFDTKVADLTISADGIIYGATSKGGIRFNIATEVFDTEPFIQYWAPLQHKFQSIGIRSDNMLFFGQQNGGLRIMRTTPTAEEFGLFEDDGSSVPSGQLFTTFVDNNDHVWIAGAGGGISEITALDGLTVPLAISETHTDVLCNGATSGSITIIPTGGVEPFTYTWDDANLSGNILTNLLAGNYEVTVSDNSGMTISLPVIIAEPTAIVTTTTSTGAIASNTDGSANVTVTGGVAPYTYLWNDVAAQTTATAMDLGAGDYTVTITDANGCTNETMVTLEMLTDTDDFKNNNAYTISPNPASQFVIIDFENAESIKSVQLISIAGKVLLHQQITAQQHKINIESYPVGIYFLQLRDSDGKVYTDKFVIRN